MCWFGFGFGFSKLRVNFVPLISPLKLIALFGFECVALFLPYVFVMCGLDGFSSCGWM